MNVLAKLTQRSPVFQGFWHGPSLGPLRTACLRSFLTRGYRFEVYTYEPVVFPDGIIAKDANAIIPHADIFYYLNSNTGEKDIGPFSDLFRFKLLKERGGWWMDIDTICLSNRVPQVRRAWAQELPELNPKAIGTSQIAFQRNDPVTVKLYDRCLALSRTDFQPREALGPHLLSDVIEELGLPKNVFGTADSFYPIRFIEMFKLWLPQFRNEIRSRTQGSFFLPVFQSFPSYIGLDLALMPPKGSYLDEACSIYSDVENDHVRYHPSVIRAAVLAYFERNADWAFRELSLVTQVEIRNVADLQALFEAGSLS